MNNTHAGRGFWINPALEWLEDQMVQERSRQDFDVYNQNLREIVQNNLVTMAILRAGLLELQEKYNSDRSQELKRGL